MYVLENIDLIGIAPDITTVQRQNLEHHFDLIIIVNILIMSSYTSSQLNQTLPNNFNQFVS